jgi:2-hydroxychromene-2-carboxylate isomerase
MSTSTDLGVSKLTVALDIRNPFAFLALRPAIEFGRELGVAINWLPFTAEPLHPPSTPSADDDRGARHRRHRAHMIAREIAIYSEAQGLTVKEPYRDAPGDAANLAWLWMRAHAPESLESFLVELFRRYWALELDAGDARDVSKVVSACGEDAARFLEWAVSEGAGAAEVVSKELEEAGVLTVPAYLVSDQIFYGRQHLPMIRWLFEDQKGPVPI